MATDGLFEAANEGKSFFEPGTYIATLMDIRPNDQQNDHPDWDPQNVWTFQLAGYPGDPDDYILRDDGEEPATLWQYSSQKMSPKAKARMWVEALLGRSLAVGEQVGLSDLIGKRMLATLVDKQSNDGKIRSVVSGVRPYNPDAQKTQYRTARRATPAIEASTDDGLPF